jgi:hypothetical protein
MKLTRIVRLLRDLAVRLATGDRGSVSVEMAVIIGVALLVAAVVLGPRILQLVQSLIGKWSIQ